MDLTPKKSSPTEWWSIFSFSCCRPPATSSSSDTAVAEEEGESYNNQGGNAAPFSLKVDGDTESLTDSPGTAACTEASAGDGDASFGSHEDDFIREVAVSTPKRKNSSSAPLCPEVNVASYEEKEDNFIGEVSISTPRYANANVSDYNEVSVVEDLSDAKTPTVAALEGDEDEDIPDVDFPLMKPPTPAKTPQKSVEEDNNTTKSTLEEQQLETKFYQFLFVMMLRHIFGYWLQGEYDPTTNIFNPSQKLLLTQGGDSEKKEYGKMMKLRKLWVKDDNKCEVVPQLKREEGSYADMPTSDE